MLVNKKGSAPSAFDNKRYRKGNHLINRLLGKFWQVGKEGTQTYLQMVCHILAYEG